jgi:trigger factor
MDIVLKKEEGLLREFSVTVSYDVFLAQERERIASVSKIVKLDGFRPGKAPAALVKAQYGDRIKGEVFRDLFEKTTKKIIAEHGLNVAGPANIDIETFKEKEPIVFYCALEVIPDAPLIDVKSLDIPKYVFFPSAEEIEGRLKKIKFLLSDKTSLDRPAEYGDTVIYREFAFDHETGAQEEGENRFFATLSEDNPDTHRFLGRSAGDHFHFDRPCTEDHDHDHGPDHRHVSVLDVVSLSDPRQDERLKKTFEAEGVEEGLYNGAKAELMTEKREFATMARRVALLETLENRYVFPLPQVMIDAEKKQILEGASRGAFEELETEESLEKMARRRVALAFLFLKYGRVHDIQVNNQDLAQAIFKDVDGDKKQFAKAVEFLKNNQQQLAALKNNILEDKVIDALLDNIAGSTRYILFRDFLLERQSASSQAIKNSAE